MQTAQCGLPAALLKGWRSWLSVKDAQHQACTDSLTHSQIPQASSVVHLSHSALKNRITGMWLHAFLLSSCAHTMILFRYRTCFDTGSKEILLYELEAIMMIALFLCRDGLISKDEMMAYFLRATRCCSVRWGLVLFTTSRRWLTWSQRSVNTCAGFVRADFIGS